MSDDTPIKSAKPGDSGPTAPSNRYRVYSTFTGSDQVAAETPYLIAPKTRFNTEIAVSIDSLYQVPPSGPPTQPNIENADFELVWSPANLAQVQPDDLDEVRALITIKNNNSWKVAAAARQALRANFADFCRRVEALELNVRMLIAGGSAVIIQRVAEALPLPINDLLAYHAGFNPGFGLNSSPYVDLQPGMRLRVDFAANQFVAPGSPLNGLVGTGQSFFAIGRDSDQRIVFDTFLSAIAAPETTAPLDQATASGVIDLQTAARRYYRLFYPTQLPPTAAPGDGRLTRNVLLVGADTRADLEAATTAYTERGEIATASAGNLPIIAVGFRGRASIVPEIGVYVNRRVDNLTHNGLIYVPVGTTLRQFLDQQAGGWNPLQLYGETGTISLRRFWSEDDGVPQYAKVMLNPRRIADVRVFDLPLLKSDMLDISFAIFN
jgi:hypothetical protein